jgi:hypothetical protein
MATGPSRTKRGGAGRRRSVLWHANALTASGPRGPEAVRKGNYWISPASVTNTLGFLTLVPDT